MHSLKSLQQELEALKSAQSKRVNNHPHTDVAGHDIKGSYINRIYMKSSSMLLFILSGLISYGHKIPFLAKIITVLSFWYGKTTRWRILIIVRKIFIVFNAIIGVFVVFKSVGFSSDNILAGFTALGGQYLEILYSFTKRLFNWFFDLFDHKVVPNTPSNPTDFNKWNPLNRIGWNTKPMHNSGFDSLRELYKTQDFYKTPFSLNVNTSSWWDTSWLWYCVVGVCSVGLLYVGYKLFTDPTWIDSMFASSNNIRPDNNLPDPSNENIPDITLTDATTSSSNSIGEALTNTFTRFTRSLTQPFNALFVSESSNREAYRNFMDKQFNLNTHNRNYFPFTTDNPYAAWYTKLRLRIFGEGVRESAERRELVSHALRDSLEISTQNGSVVIKGCNTPVASLMGLGTPNAVIQSSLAWDQIQSLNHTSQTLKHAPSVPLNFPTTPGLLPDIEQWKAYHKPAFNAEQYDKFLEHMQTLSTHSNVASSSKVLVEDMIDDEVQKVADMIAELSRT